MTKHVEAHTRKAKRIFTVGQSGAGKDVVAEEVAKQLGWQFIHCMGLLLKPFFVFVSLHICAYLRRER